MTDISTQWSERIIRDVLSNPLCINTEILRVSPPKVVRWDQHKCVASNFS